MARTPKILVLIAAATLCGCSTSHLVAGEDAAPVPDAAVPDGGSESDAGAAACAGDRDCDDHRFCNGRERCSPGDPFATSFGCVSAETPACLPSQTCDEGADACLSPCDVDADLDDDGHAALNCGGDDCDDARADVAPGLAEVCDAAGVDEDCDPSTLGDDADGDGHVAARCCNGGTCGDDCDDADAARSPGAAEICNGIDDDCNGVLDAPLEDRDRDGHVSPECGGLDCDDESADAWPGAPELCNGRDDDCDGASPIDEPDRDGDGASSSVECSVGEGSAWDCDDRVDHVGPLAAELCNGLDDDCDTHIDEALAGCAVSDGPVQVEVGSGFACARRASGAIACWGTDQEAQHGDGAPGSFSAVPVPAAIGIDDAIDLQLGLRHACAIRADHSIVCWGSGYGAPTPAGPPDARALAAGLDFTCALRGDGRVSCWGANADGQLGIGTRASTAGVVDVIGIDDAVAIAAGNEHACAVREAGTVQCWGDGGSGTLGDGVSNGPTPTPVEVVVVRDVLTIAAGGAHTCALDRDGAAWCWGRNAAEQLGDPAAPVYRTVPGRVSGTERYRAIAAGGNATCASIREGTVHCWGDGVSTPTALPGLAVARHVDVGTFATCAVRRDGTIGCRGSRSTGQLGDGGSSSFAWPVPVADLSDGAAVEVSGDTSCALRRSGGISCWGHLPGIPAPGAYTTPSSQRPVAMPGFVDARALSVSHASLSLAAIRIDGTLAVYGVNETGQFGLGHSLPVFTATDAPAWGLVTDVNVQGAYQCAVGVDGAVRCAGHGSYGQVGPSTWSSTPIAVTDVSSATSVRADEYWAMAVLGDGRVMQWSFGSTTEVAGLPPTRTLLGRCLIDATGDAWCRGSNTHGQVGDGTTANRTSHVRVVDLHGVSVLAENALSACAIRSGEVLCWGRTGLDALVGLDTTRPQRVPGIDDAVDVSMTDAEHYGNGPGHGCIVRSTGQVLCWGDDVEGQLGDGLGSPGELEPVTVAPLP